MARTARLVVADHPHHVVQRGNRNQPVFFGDGDYRAYLEVLAECAKKAGTAVWAYCLMPNHVQLIMVPSTADGLRAALAEAHRRYTRMINQREDWRGHLWQERFHSYVMDEAHLLHAARYVALNPVKAGLAARPEDWRWSSAAAHLAGKGDGLVDVQPLLERIGNWADFLQAGVEEAMTLRLETHLRTGRPLGGADWVEALESRLDRPLRPRKPGPKPASKPAA